MENGHIEKLAMFLYDEYCTSVGGKAFNGDPLPKSEEFFNDALKQKQVKAWIDVAIAARYFLNPSPVKNE